MKSGRIKATAWQYLCMAAIALTSCVEHISEEARYTFTGHTIASFMESHEEIYSSFIEILDRGGRLSLMKAYGQYTCFAPTNEAVARHLFEQDSIYRASLIDDNPDDVVWTGITSPELSELSDSMCRVIADTHIIPYIYMTLDMEGDVIPDMNMNDRYLSLSFDVNEEGYSLLKINGNAEIIAKDEEVENGVIHTVSSVLNPSTNTVPAQIEGHGYFHIFSEALAATGYDDILQGYKDDSYTDGDRKDKFGNPYPTDRYYGFTAFVEPDQVFFDAGIYNLDDLILRCHEWYPDADPDAPLTSKENPLNQFVGYHLLNRKLPYSRLVCYKITTSIFNSEADFFSRSNRYEYFETMNNRLLKVAMPRSVDELQTTILLNYSKDTSGASEEQLQYMNVVVHDPEAFRDSDTLYAGFQGEALNGTVHAIDKILLYNEDVMAGRVVNEVIRVDFAAICEELTNNAIRWYYSPHSSNGDIFIPHTWCEDLKVYAEETRLYYLAGHTSWCDYQGDELMAFDAFDFAYRLPPVPAGTYELRIGYTANSYRNIIQMYVDNEVTGIPVDLRILASHPSIGYVSDKDAEKNGDPNGIMNDKEMKNRGYLKGPITVAGFGGFSSGSMRDTPDHIRKVITTKYLTAGEHWLRFKSVHEGDDGTAEFMHDYIEIVPLTFLRNENLTLEEKRM